MPIDPEVKSEEQESTDEAENLTRRKVLWIAPAIVTRRLIYAAAGCGKAEPFSTACQISPSGSS